MHRDLLLDQEIVWINKQHQWELENHEMCIHLMKKQLQEDQESRQAQDGELSVLKALVEQWMGQVKGKGKVSDPTPEAAGAGAGNLAPPPRRRAAGAPRRGGGGDSDDEGEGSGRTPDESRKGRRDERPAHQLKGDYDAENDELFIVFFPVMANALGQGTRVPVEPPALFKKEKHQDIRMWLLACMDYLAKTVGSGKTTSNESDTP